MSINYWLKRWQDNDIGFHEQKVNPYLDRYFTNLNVKQNGRVFVPLCGKTNDIGWLLEKQFKVVGVELSEEAIIQLFDSLSLTAKVTTYGALKLYQANNLTIWVGDIFSLSSTLIGVVDAIYDRGALVALPLELRAKYTAHLIQITNNAPQLLICCVYDQSKRDGTPYSVTAQEVFDHYHRVYTLKLVKCQLIKNGIKGVEPANALVWLLSKNNC